MNPINYWKNAEPFEPKAVQQTGFTLIEVLLALAVIAIALMALLKSTAQTVANTQRIKEKTVSHWVAMQGVAMIQSGLLKISLNQQASQSTKMFGQRWYWHATASNTPLKAVQQINISVSEKQAGPFGDPLVAFRYAGNDH